MTSLGILILAAGVVLAVIQISIGLKLVQKLKAPSPPLLADGECPWVLAVLCLRGTDPFLPESLRRLFAQDYPNYTVRIVIDTADDPARPLVEEAIREQNADHVELLVLDDRNRHCSAKMSSLLLATERLPDDCQYVATFDGDALLHPSCLRELISAQVQSGADVASGNRGFAPESLSLGAIGRFLWNQGCLPLMYAMGLPWGGCLAMSRQLISEPELRELYRGAFAEDMLLGSYVKRRDKSLVFVPDATIVNWEDISVRGLVNFLTRQMLCVRLHHHQWKLILGLGIFATGLSGVICPLGLLVPGLRGWCLASLVVMLVGSIITTGIQGNALRRLLSRREERLIKLTPWALFKILMATLPTQWIILLANLKALVAQTTTWRGLTYRFGKDPIVTLVREVPVSQLDAEALSPAQTTATPG